MSGFEIFINGKLVCQVGTDTAAQYGVYVGNDPQRAEPKVTVNGYRVLDVRTTESLKWGEQILMSGDEVIIRVVDQVDSSQPIERSTFDSSANTAEFEEKIARSMAELRLKEEEFKRQNPEWDQKPKIEELYCSFCGKSKTEVARLIAGPAVHICDECVRACDDILAGKSTGNRDWPENA